MSVHAISWVLKNSEARGGARLVMIVLADHASRDGTDSYPSVKTIASEARMSERAVQYALVELLQAGEVIETGVSKWATRVFAIPGMGGGADIAPPADSAPPGVQKVHRDRVQILHPNRPKENRPSKPSSNDYPVAEYETEVISAGRPRVQTFVDVAGATNEEAA